jgi:hypothetical protein
MAAVWVVYWICVTKWFEDPVLKQRQVELSTLSAASTHRVSNPTSDSSSSLHSVTVRVTTQGLPPQAEVQPTSPSTHTNMTLPQWGVTFTMCWFAMTCFFVLGAWEANLPVFGAPGAGPFEWSPFAAGNFIALGGICAFPFLAGNVSYFLPQRETPYLRTSGLLSTGLPRTQGARPPHPRIWKCSRRHWPHHLYHTAWRRETCERRARSHLVRQSLRLLVGHRHRVQHCEHGHGQSTQQAAASRVE